MTTWTEDRIATLKRLWNEGQSASVVARELGGVTRNAVIGKVHRLGLSGRVAPAAPGAGRRASKPSLTTPVRRKPRLAGVVGRVIVAEAMGDEDRERTPLLRLRRAGCRWVFGDPKAEAFGFCTAAATRGSYCAEHAALAYRPRSPVERLEDARPPARWMKTG